MHTQTPAAAAPDVRWRLLSRWFQLKSRSSIVEKTLRSLKTAARPVWLWSADRHSQEVKLLSLGFLRIFDDWLHCGKVNTPPELSDRLREFTVFQKMGVKTQRTSLIATKSPYCACLRGELYRTGREMKSWQMTRWLAQPFVSDRWQISHSFINIQQMYCHLSSYILFKKRND